MKTICSKCVVDLTLKNIIKKDGKSGKCLICEKDNEEVISWDDKNFRSVFRGLIRYNYSEWDYNIHWGGNGLEDLLYKENPIVKEFQENDKFEEMIREITEPGYYYDYDTGVSLYAGYDENGQQNQLLRALKNDIHSSLQQYQKRLEKQNYFLMEDEVHKLLKVHLKNLEKIFPNESVLYRARIGFKYKGTPLNGFGSEWHYKPYEHSEISAPPPLITGNGRMNRVGVSFMYLATNRDTAISEIRPHPGQKVSIGTFKSKREMKIVDFNLISIADYACTDNRLDDYLLINSINQLFSMPITPEERTKYSFTQFLADIIRKQGFDGIAYKSSIGDGVNYVFFDPNLFVYVDDSGEVLTTESLVYEHRPMRLMDGGEYATNLNGDFLNY